MKKNKLLAFALVAIMASFTACTNDAELVQESEIKLTSEITPSRVTSLDYQSTQIIEGQQVGVTITGAKTEHKNVAWTVGETGQLTNTGDAIYYGDGTTTITAYHPYKSTWTGTSHEFSVSTDQSTNDGYLASDLLWATATSSKTEAAVPLVFSHKLAKINVTLLPEKEGDDLIGAIISIYNTKILTTFNSITGGISAATGNATEIVAGTTDDAYTASAIVVPQEVSGKFIKVAHGGKTYYYTLTSGKTLKSGHSYSYTLTIKGNQLISTSSSINPWEDESGNAGDAGEDENGNTGDAEEEVVVSKSVKLTYSGSLSKAISEDEKYKITSLTISGPLNNDDINFINQMVKKGDDVPTGGKEGSLKSLDLKESTITTSQISLSSNILETLVLPNGLETVALHCSSLTSVNIPEGVLALNLSGCSELESINLPNGLQVALLDYCEALESVNLPNGIAIVRMSNCSSLTSIDVPNGIKVVSNFNLGSYPSREKHIDLSNCTSLTTVTLPNTVTEIANNAFQNCVSLKNISISENLEVIGYEAFLECKALTNIKLPNSITEIGNMAFADCSSLSSISLPSSLSKLGFGAFIGCQSLYSVTFNSNIDNIQQDTFVGCRSLTSIAFPNGVKTIGPSALAGCISLESVTLPSSVTSLGAQLFNGCSKIKEIHCQATEPPTAEENTFLTVSSSCSIYVPQNSSASYKQADYWKFFGNNIKEE